MASNEYCYHFADFLIRSELPLPDLWPADPDSDEPGQVVLKRGKVDDLIETGITPVRRGICYQCTADELVLRTPVAAFRIRRGCEVIVEPVAGKPEADMRPFVSGSVMAALCYQRGIFVMHGCALQWQGRGILLCGTSGSGKSTLGYGLMEKGCRLLADEIVPLKVVDGQLLLLPGKRSLYLWRDTAEYFQLPGNVLSPVRNGLLKYAVSLEEATDFFPAGVAISSTVILSKASTAEPITLKAVAAVGAFDLLLKIGSYRHAWIEAMQLDRQRFDAIAQAVRSGAVYQFPLFQGKAYLSAAIERLRTMIVAEADIGAFDVI